MNEYLGASLEIPDWVACEATYCLVGTGSTIHVYTQHPINEVGSFDSNVPSPYQKLIAIGFTNQQATALLERGTH
jgi:hypothetical protein